MACNAELSAEDVSQLRADYFEMLAGIGITKHIGSLAATELLVEWCHIGEGSYVLDVGCGVGATPIYLARAYGCRVLGVDLVEKMIARSNERLRGAGLDDKVEFQVADAVDLPFADASFDAVIAESVLAFIDDRQKALSEWMRVTKPGGYVGFTEATWTKTPPPEVDEYMYRTTGAQLEVSEAWEELLNRAGLGDTEAGAYRIDMKAESSGRIKRLGLKTSLAALPRMLGMLLKSLGSRSIISNALSVPKSAFEHMGYGVYAGRKA